VHGLAEPHSLVEALRGGQDVLQLAAETARNSPDEVIPAAQVVLRAPVPVPPSIRARSNPRLLMKSECISCRSSILKRNEESKLLDMPVNQLRLAAAKSGRLLSVLISPGGILNFVT
jgi:hypothetical protein